MEPFVTNRYVYGPYGEPLHYDNEKERQGFIGKEKDLESGLADHGVRKYDYISGRFTSIDPLSEKFYGLSPYQYSYNNPISFLDNNGLSPEELKNIIQGNGISFSLNKMYSSNKVTGNEYGALIWESDNGLGYPIIGINVVPGKDNTVDTDLNISEEYNRNFTIARAHTHLNGHAPSYKDFSKLGDPSINYKYSIIEAGNKRFAIEVLNHQKAYDLDESLIKSLWFKEYFKSINKGNTKVEASRDAAIGVTQEYNDIYKLYETNDSEKTNFKEIK